MGWKNKRGKNAFWTNKFEGRIVEITRGRNGRECIRREVTAPCNRCGQGFTFTMTTKPTKYCPACRAIVDAEKRQLAREREALRLPRASVPAEHPRVRKIPYAGYDGDEL